MNGEHRAEHARRRAAKGATSLVVCGDGGQCLHEANVFLEIEKLSRPDRVSMGEEASGGGTRINFFMRTQRFFLA